jgi:hypothetical protein
VAYARYPGDPGIAALVTEMLALSPQFAELWSAHEVEARGPMLKHVDHPLAWRWIRCTGRSLAPTFLAGPGPDLRACQGSRACPATPRAERGRRAAAVLISVEVAQSHLRC